jgi:hypothetical protein
MNDSSEIRWDRLATCPARYSLFQGVAHDYRQSPTHAKKNTKLLFGRIFFLICALDDEEGCNDYSDYLNRASVRIFDNGYSGRKINYRNNFPFQFCWFFG